MRVGWTQTIPEQISLDSVPVERHDERARMGRISGGLWMVGALVGIVGTFLPGAYHGDAAWVLVSPSWCFAYGLGSVTGLIPWERASMQALAIGMVATIPVVGLAIYMTGGSISYIEPLLVCSLLYAALFFPARWAWPLSIELVLVAGAPLLYDDSAIDTAFVPRYLALAAGFLAVTWVMVGLKKRLVEAEARQREIANRDPLTGIANRRAFDAVLRRRAGWPLRRRRPPRRRRRARSPCCSSTSTTSRRSTTTTATRSATRSCARPPSGPARCCARPTPSPGSAATSSR